jgi:hypothetical protein
LGPLIHLQSSPGRAVALLVAVLFLTLLTQVGGVVLWVALPFFEFLHGKARQFGTWLAWGAPISGFVASYALAVFAIVPPLAGLFDRQSLPCFASAHRPFAASSMLVCAANRHYAKPAVHRLLTRVGRGLTARFPGSVVTYLDAGFPFFDGFPLLPHLSHRDGKTIDLAFFYRDAESGQRISRAAAWSVGYWAFARPRPGEPQPCRRAAPSPTLRWDFAWLQPLFVGVRLDEPRTKVMLDLLVREARADAVDRILLEPYLRARWRLPRQMVRFQGCRAARHDDHMHVQLK